MALTKLRSTLLLFVAILIFKGCGTSDTVTVVPSSPQTTTAADTTDDDEEEFFQQITVGLIDSVTNFDPLFADNLSTKRVISLIYDGLFTLDRDGEPVPVIAEEVEVSDDGREYLITINRNLFFHESPAFPAGVGRRISAADVKYSLERTAFPNVPPHAAELLMNVHGFQNYYLEQRYVYDTDRHVVDGVSGIEVVDSGTILIALKREDPDFLKRLASPLLSIYPREAVNRGEHGLKTQPVGTGHFLFTSFNDERIILTLDDSEAAEQRADRPRVNRIDFTFSVDEGRLFQRFARGEIDWIPEVGPQVLRQVANNSFELRSTYRNQFELNRHNSERVTSLYLNDNAEIDISWLRSRLLDTETDDLELMGDVELNMDVLEENGDSDPDSEYYVTYTDDSYTRHILSRLNASVMEPDSRLRLLDIRVPTPETALFSRTTDTLHYSFTNTKGISWLTAQHPIVSLHHSNIMGIESHSVPWRLFPAEIRVRSNDRESL
ncbi:MAG: ABC transporter substrate-binding protein [Balneolaceae bacterium]|nr:ABC transporter substrate-binding protein [Balneolaceae bacterium]MCH8548124.1 ABC transporter substrate-binding protein [Balneolaceae bacterium]